VTRNCPTRPRPEGGSQPAVREFHSFAQNANEYGARHVHLGADVMYLSFRSEGSSGRSWCGAQFPDARQMMVVVFHEEEHMVDEAHGYLQPTMRG
jgi:hypothetical protein